MARQDLAYAITVNDAQLRLATQHVAAFNAELGASTLTGARVDEAMRSVGRRTVQVGNFFTRYLTIPAVIAGVAAGKMSADFERSLAKIQGLTQTSAADTQRLGNAALQLSSTTITKGPAGLADAMFKLRSVGFSVNQTIAAMPAIAKAAAVGLGSVATVADAVASALDAYGIAGQNAGKNVLTAAQATGVLIGTVTAGKIAPEELARSIGRVIPVANALGISFDQVGASIASITRQQGSANLAVTGIRALLSQIERAQPQTTKALASIGTSPAAVLEAVKNPKIGLFPTLLALRDQIEGVGKKPLKFNAKELIAGLNGDAAALAKIKASVGDSNQALSKLFPNIRALTAFLIITGTRRNQNQTIFSALSFDIQHAQEVIKRAYEAKIRTPIGQLELQLSKLRTTGTELGHSFITLGAKFLSFVNGLISAGTSVGHVLDKLGPLKTFFKDAGVGLLIFGPVVALFGRLVQAASFGVTMWGRWQAAATKAAYAIQGINIDEDKAVIAHQKATVQFVTGFNSVAAAADRAAVASGRVGAGLGVRGGIAAATAGTALLTKTSGGSALSRGGSAALRVPMANQVAAANLAAFQVRRQELLNEAKLRAEVATQRVGAAEQAVALSGAGPGAVLVQQQLAQARAIQATALARVRDAEAATQTVFKDEQLVLLTKQLQAAQTTQMSFAARGYRIAAEQQTQVIAGLETEIALRQKMLAGGVLAPGGGFGAFNQRAVVLQQTKAAEEAAALETKTPTRIMATNFGTAINGMRSTAKLGFDFIALSFAANMIGKVVFDSHKTKEAVTHDLFDIQKAGVGAAAALGVLGLGLAGLATKAGGITKIGAALGESGIAAVLMQNKLRLAIAALIGLQFTGVKTETIFNAAMVGMLAKTLATKAGIEETGAAFGPWGVAIATAATVILSQTGLIQKAVNDVEKSVGLNPNKGTGGFIKNVLETAVLFGPKLLGAIANKHDSQSKKMADKAKQVDDTLFKQLEQGLSRTGAIGDMVKAAEQLRAAGQENAAEQTIAAAQVKQQKLDIIAARNFLKSHGKDALANELFPVAQQIKQAKKQFDTLFGNIQNSLDNAFSARTSRMLDNFDQQTQTLLDNFDQKSQDLADHLSVKVNVKKLNETFTIKVNGKTPAERELDALDKVAQKRSFQRDTFDARDALATAFQVGDPNAIRDAQRKLQDAQSAERKFGLEKRATLERSAADTATKKAQRDLADRRKRERQAIEDSRQDTRRNMEALRTIQQQNLNAALANEKTLFDNGKISLGKYKNDVLKIMRTFNISIAQAGKDGGQAYADQMRKYFTQLTTDIGVQLDKITAKANGLAAHFRQLSQGLAANFAEIGLQAKGSHAGPAAAAAALGAQNPVTLAKIALGLPTRVAIIAAIRQLNGGIGDATLEKLVPGTGRPNESQYKAFLKRVKDPKERTELQSRLRGQGFFGANTGAVVPGSGTRDTVHAMLTPGEVVFNRKQQRNLGQRLGMPGAGPRELFDEIRRPQKFATGGVVQRENAWDAVARMQRDGYTDRQIAGQFHRWHSDVSIKNMLEVIKWKTQKKSLIERFAGDIGHIVKGAPGGLLALGKTIAAPTYYDILYGPSSSQASKARAAQDALAKSAVMQPIHDLRHPLRHPGYTALDLVPALSKLLGVSRVAAVGRGVGNISVGGTKIGQVAREAPGLYKDIATKAFYPGDEYSVAEMIRKSRRTGLLSQPPKWLMRLLKEESGQVSMSKLSGREGMVEDWFKSHKSNYPTMGAFRGRPSLEQVAINKLVATQSWHKPPGLEGGPIDVIKGPDGKLYVTDGHHRVARAMLEGKPNLYARVRAIAQHVAHDATGSLFLGGKNPLRELLRGGKAEIFPSMEQLKLPRDGSFFYHGTNLADAQSIIKSGRLKATAAERAGGGQGPMGAWFTKNPEAAAFWGKYIVGVPEALVGDQLKRHPLGIYSSEHDVIFNKNFRGLKGAAAGGLSRALNSKEVQIFGEFEPKKELYPQEFARYRALSLHGKAVQARSMMAGANAEILAFAEKLGLDVPEIRPGLATWRGQKNIGFGIHVKVPEGGASAPFMKKVEALSAYVGEKFHQGSLSYGRPLAAGTRALDGHPGVFWDARGQDIGKMQNELDSLYGEGSVGIMHSPDRKGYYVVDFAGKAGTKLESSLAKIGITGKRIVWEGGYTYDKRLASYGAPNVSSFQRALSKQGFDPKEGLRHTKPNLQDLSLPGVAKRVREAAKALGLKQPEDLAGPLLLRQLKQTSKTIADGWELNWDWYLRHGAVVEQIGALTGTDPLLLSKLTSLSIQTSPAREVARLGKVAKALGAGKGLPSAKELGVSGAQYKSMLKIVEDFKKNGPLHPAGERSTTGPKTWSYGANKIRAIDREAYAQIYGDANDYVTLDRHHTRQQLPLRYHSGKGEPIASPGPAYRYLEQLFLQLGKAHGVDPEMLQAAWWLPTKAANEFRLAKLRTPGRQNMFDVTQGQHMQLASDAGEAGFRKEFGDRAFSDLLKVYRERGLGQVLDFNVPFRFKFQTGGTVPGSGVGDTVPAMLTPGEMVLNRGQQLTLGERLGMRGASASALFSAIAQRFAGGGVVNKKPRPAPQPISEHGQQFTLPTIDIPGLGDLTDAMKKLVKLVAKNAVTQEQLPQDPKTMKLILGGSVDARGKFTRLETPELKKLRHALDPVSAVSELRSTIPHFDSLAVAKKRELEAQVARIQAHPFRAGLFTPTPTGTTTGGTRTLPPSHEINVRAFEGAGHPAQHVTIHKVEIHVDGAGDPVKVARETRREFERLATHIVQPRRGGNL